MWVKAGCTVFDSHAMCEMQRAISIGSSGNSCACGNERAM